jgi:hypothetical protein
VKERQKEGEKESGREKKERVRKRERERKREGEREKRVKEKNRELERKRERCKILSKGMTGDLAPFSYLVLNIFAENSYKICVFLLRSFRKDIF